MTEVSCYLDSHPKFFLMIGASIFSLQVNSIQQTFPGSRKFQRQFHQYWQLVSHFFLCPAECHEAGTPKDRLTFLRQVQQSFLCGSYMSSFYSILSNSPGKSSFLPKWLANSLRSLFDVHLPLEAIEAARCRCVSLS